MTIDEVLRRVEEIRALAADDEAAHSKEDNLHQDVLNAIAIGECADPRGCALVALGTKAIQFGRWCA